MMQEAKIGVIKLLKVIGKHLSCLNLNFTIQLEDIEMSFSVKLKIQ